MSHPKSLMLAYTASALALLVISAVLLRLTPGPATVCAPAVIYNEPVALCCAFDDVNAPDELMAAVLHYDTVSASGCAIRLGGAR